MTPDQIADSLRAMGAGSHCVVGIDRSTGDGHWFNAYFDGDTVWSIDAQTGTRSPWPPNEPNATNWDASIRPEDVADPKTPDTPETTNEDSTSPSPTEESSSVGNTPETDVTVDGEGQDGDSSASRNAAPDPTDPRPRLPEYSADFTPNAAHDRVEFERQLDLQETGLNQLTVADFLANRDAYLDRAENSSSGRDPQAAAAQQSVRQRELEEWINNRTDELEAAGIDFDDAEMQARREGEEWLSTQAALHSPDQVAGGFADRLTGVGDRQINSSLGSQWRTRIVGLDAFVRSIADGMSPDEMSTTLLNIRLTFS
jgi:hypothetical protein